MTQAPPLRIGVLGAATIAPVALLRPARRLPDVAVVAVAARDPARARRFARRYGVARVHPSYADLLADPDIDAVYNPLPNSLHAAWSIRALEAGKHVLCEKPLAANADEAAQMATAAATAGRVLMEAFHYRYHPLAPRLKAIVDSGELGQILHLEVEHSVPFLALTNIRYRYDLAGGATMDTGCYAINLIRYLAGAEPEVRAATARTIRPQVDRWMAAELVFADGRTARMVCALLSRTVFRARAVEQGTAGELRCTSPFVPQLYHRVEVHTGAGVRRERMLGEATYTYQLRAFVSAVRAGRAVPTDAQDAIANMRVIDAVYERAGLQRRGL